MSEPKKKRGRPWPRGTSGNPAGKPRGAVSKSTKLRRAIEKDLPAVIDALLDAARGGDVQAASVLLSRSLPPLRPSRESVAVDGVTAESTPAEIALAVVRAAAAGRLPADVASDLASALASIAKIEDIEEQAARLAAVEKELAKIAKDERGAC
jgi:hypothetical protein